MTFLNLWLLILEGVSDTVAQALNLELVIPISTTRLSFGILLVNSNVGFGTGHSFLT